MFETIKSKLNSSSSANVSPADVARDISELHETMDAMKEWSQDTEAWLADEQQRLVEEGEQEYADELDDLLAYVQSVYFRVEYGDYAINEANEKLDSENAAGADE